MNTHNEGFEFRALSSEETFHFFWDLIEEIDSQNLVEDAKKNTRDTQKLGGKGTSRNSGK